MTLGYADPRSELGLFKARFLGGFFWHHLNVFFPP